MSMAANLYTPLAVILFFTMLTTLRFSVAGTLKTANPALRLVTHPAWLYALVLAGGYTLGAFYHGAEKEKGLFLGYGAIETLDIGPALVRLRDILAEMSRA